MLIQPITNGGCIYFPMQWMEEDVEPMIGIYSGVGIAIALTELVTLVLMCAYVAHINRRREHEMDYAKEDHEDGDKGRRVLIHNDTRV